VAPHRIPSTVPVPVVLAGASCGPTSSGTPSKPICPGEPLAAAVVVLEAPVLFAPELALALAEAELVELALELDELPQPARARAPIRSASAEREPGRMGPQP
jgi:hypothetical protein